MPVMQVRIVRMLMRYSVMRMEMRMPFVPRHCFTIMQMVMMTIGMLVVMNMFHNNMRMHMSMRKQVCNDNSKRQKSN